MTLFHLVRHGAHELQGGVLVARGADVALSALGKRQADFLAGRLAHEPIAALFASPRLRTRMTAEAIAHRHDLDVSIEAALDEVDMGDWTGKSFAELDQMPEWRRFNELRSVVRPPQGELMAEVRARVIGMMLELSAERPRARIVLVTHGDVIRAAILHCLGMADEAVHRIAPAPGSLSTLALGEGPPCLLRLNEEMGDAR